VRRPKLLYLVWEFPPTQSIASVRTWNVAKHLSRLGWDVTVLTPDPRLMRQLEKAERVKAELATEGIKQILTNHHWRFLTPDRLNCRNRGVGWFFGGLCRRVARRLGVSSGIGWTRSAEQASRALRPADVDMILASGPPFSSFVLAERLSKYLQCPYVLDYRDPWWTEIGDILPSLRWLVERLERRLVAGAAAVTIVSPLWAADLNSRFNISSKLHVITNGYDKADLVDTKPHDFGHFSVVYTGIFYPPTRVITPVFEALERIKAKGRAWQFHYYGHQEQHVRDEALRLGISDHVTLHGRVPRSEVLSAIKGADIAVVIASVSNEDSVQINGWIPAKLFETIGLGTPVLLIASPASDAATIAEPTGLVRTFSGEDINGIASFIEDRMSSAAPAQKCVDTITWPHLASRLDAILRKESMS
jgi:glycosyltransferase involved in cell wall biosynthesis